MSDWANIEAHVIPDRLKLAHYNKQRQHADVDPVRFIWFGSAQNRGALTAGFVTLSRLQADGFNVELTIMDDRPDLPLGYGPSCPVYFVRWQLDKEVEVIANHDIALLPPYPGEWGKVKSNNKVLAAWACGLPVETTHDYGPAYEMTFNPLWRDIAEHRRKLEDVSQSAADWEALLC